MKIGIIGCTNITKAMVYGFIKGGIDPKEITITDKDAYEVHITGERFGVNMAKNRRELAEKCNLIILSERAHLYSEVAHQINDLITPDHVIISIAPNMTIAEVESRFGNNTKIVRAKPNTPAIVGESMTGICKNPLVTLDEYNFICNLMLTFGVVEEVPESLMDVVIAVSSSSPAYIFMFIEAMADAASSDGMPRDMAYEFAAQAVLGSAKMIIETGMHPGKLKDMVCSPGGTTLEAVRVLESHGLRSSVFEAVKACAAHCKKM